MRSSSHYLKLANYEFIEYISTSLNIPRFKAKTESLYIKKPGYLMNAFE
tara:strand:+ start:615 stop:761 length:147 start_codon:yes stop_codon:yes gene_type:complete